MSQSGILNVENSNPQIPTLFVTNSGNAVPIANTLELLGEVVANAGIPFRSVGSGNTVTYQIQYANETAVTDATIVGLAAFDSAAFDVDANGFVTLLGGGVAATNIDVDASTAPGTDPVVPDGAGNIVITGAQVAAGTVGANVIRTDSLAANSLTIEIQRTNISASTDSTKNGVSHFNANAFSVDVNGFVSLLGGGQAIDSLGVQATSGTGTDPVVPNASGTIEMEGALVVAGTNPLRAVSTAINTLQYQLQTSQALAATDATKVGVCNFDSAAFSVDANGFVSLLGGSIAIDSIGVDATSGAGTNPVLPTAAGLITVNGAVVAASTTPIRSVSTAANVYQIQVQTSQAIAATDATKIGLSNFDSSKFTVDANGFVSTSGTGIGNTITGQSGGALSPTAGNWNISGAVTAAGTSPVVTSGAVSTLTVNVQTSQALAAADATKIGLSNFDSASFAVAATGFVTLSTTGVGKTITGDSGGALSPTANNWNILGLSGSKTSGSGSTLTVKSPPFSQVGSSATSSLNTGEFVTAAVTRTLPASAGLADGDLFIYVCTTAGALVVQSVTAQKIRLGNVITSAAGSATSTAIGDSLTLRFNATDGFFYAVASTGNWTLSP